MSNRLNLGRKFRELIARPQPLFGFGVGNALEASLAQKAGVECIYNGGYTEAMYQMQPDMGRRNMVEVRDTTWSIVEAVNIPVIADIDDGYGNALNAMRAASEFFGKEFIDIASGPPWRVKRLAGIHIEDQRFPKRCGHIAGKDTVSVEEFEGKVRAVSEVRDAFDKDAVIIARTDFYHSQKPGSLAVAAQRIVRAARAGANLGWYEDNQTKRGTAWKFADLVHMALPDFPLAYNYTPSNKWYLENDPMTFDDLNQMGYKFIFITIAAGHAASQAVYDYARGLVERGAVALWDMQESKVGHPTESHHQMAGVPTWQALERTYIPEAEERQKSGEGAGSGPGDGR